MSTPDKKYFVIFFYYNTKYYNCGMKRTILTLEVDPELLEHLKNQAVKKKVTVSRLVRAAIKKATKYKEKALV